MIAAIRSSTHTDWVGDQELGRELPPEKLGASKKYSLSLFVYRLSAPSQLLSGLQRT
jgi:hypothetical protein